MTAAVAKITYEIQRTHHADAASKRYGKPAGRACYFASRLTKPPKTGNWGLGGQIELTGEKRSFYAFLYCRDMT